MIFNIVMAYAICINIDTHTDIHTDTGYLIVVVVVVVVVVVDVVVDDMGWCMDVLYSMGMD